MSIYYCSLLSFSQTNRGRDRRSPTGTGQKGGFLPNPFVMQSDLMPVETQLGFKWQSGSWSTSLSDVNLSFAKLYLGRRKFMLPITLQVDDCRPDFGLTRWKVGRKSSMPRGACQSSDLIAEWTWSREGKCGNSFLHLIYLKRIFFSFCVFLWLSH